MKKIICLLLCSVMLSGCGLALKSCLGIPATEYGLRDSGEKSIDYPIMGALWAAHGGATYLLWITCWPAAVAYLGVSGLYTAIRLESED